MHAKAGALLEAHVQYSLDQLSGEKFRETIKTEVTGFYSWVGERPVKTLLDEVRVRDFLLRNLLEKELTPGLRGQIRLLITRGLQSPLNADTRIEHLLNVNEFDAIIDKALQLEDLRRALVHELLSSPIFSEVLSDLLYHSIKGYLLEDGGISKKVPGMSSLVKLGKGVVGRMGGLEDTIESAIKQYTQKNIRRTVELSEGLIESVFRGPKIKQVAREFWGRIKLTRVGDITRYAAGDDVEDASQIVNTIWHHARQTDYTRQLLNELVHAWFENYGERPAAALLQDLGLTPEGLAGEIAEVITPFADIMRQTGYLEERVRAHLQPFYGSDAVATLLSQE